LIIVSVILAMSDVHVNDLFSFSVNVFNLTFLICYFI